MRKKNQELYDFVVANVEGRTARELAELVSERFGETFSAEWAKNYKNRYHLRSGTPTGKPKGDPTDLFPLEIYDFIIQNHKGVGPSGMTKLVNETFGTAYVRQQLKTFYTNRKLNSGTSGRFTPGHIPYNKGRKGQCAEGSERGWFTEGHKPHNKTPLGTVLPKAGGYLYKKVGEGARDWLPLHRMIWEEANGPVPEKHALIFLDGDIHNVTLDNLALVSRAELARINNRHLRSSDPELTKAGVLIARLITSTAEKEKRKHERKSDTHRD